MEKVQLVTSFLNSLAQNICVWVHAEEYVGLVSLFLHYRLLKWLVNGLPRLIVNLVRLAKRELSPLMEEIKEWSCTRESVIPTATKIQK